MPDTTLVTAENRLVAELAKKGQESNVDFSTEHTVKYESPSEYSQSEQTYVAASEPDFKPLPKQQARSDIANQESNQSKSYHDIQGHSQFLQLNKFERPNLLKHLAPKSDFYSTFDVQNNSHLILPVTAKTCLIRQQPTQEVVNPTVVQMAFDDYYQVSESGTLNIAKSLGVLANDQAAVCVLKINDSSANIGIPTPLAFGALLTLNADGSFTYKTNGKFEFLAQGQTFTDSFSYQMQDTFGGLHLATAYITVNGKNDILTANNDAYTAFEDTKLIVPAKGVLSNDTDIDGADVLVVSAVQGDPSLVGVPVSLKSGAIVTVQADGGYSYDPNGKFNDLAKGTTATDSFQYTASDGQGDTDTAKVTITIVGENDLPSAFDDYYSVLENNTLTVNKSNGVLKNDSDPDNDALSVTKINGQSIDIGNALTIHSGAIVTLNSDGSFTYKTNGMFDYLAVGQSFVDSFTYEMTDNHGEYQTAKVFITVNGVNDVPQAVNDVGTINEDAILTVNAPGVLANDIDTDTSDVLFVFAIQGKNANVGIPVTLSSGAIVTLQSDGGYTYNPNGKFEHLSFGTSTTDSFTYKVSDGNGGTSSNGTVTITINGVNDFPFAKADSYSVKSTKMPLVKNILANDRDPDTSDTLIVSEVNGINSNVGTEQAIAGGHYTITSDGTLTFDTATKGVYQLNYTASDQHGGTSIGDIKVTVTPIVLDLNQDNVISLISSKDSHVNLNNFVATNEQSQMGWVGQEDGILVYDYQHDNIVTHLNEFEFSSYSCDAKTDLEGLRLAFDSNHDLILDEYDEHFHEFGVWQDKNGNGITDRGEFSTLTELGIRAISLQSDHAMSLQNDNIIFGNTHYETTSGLTFIAQDVGLSLAPYQEQLNVRIEDVFQDVQQLDFSGLTDTHSNDVFQSNQVYEQEEASVIFHNHILEPLLAVMEI